jgi:hypothetical protein
VKQDTFCRANEDTGHSPPRLSYRLLPPVVVFLLQRAVLAAVAWLSGYDPVAASSWSRGDSAYYLSIAAVGYEPLYHCPPESHYPPSAWCGNAGWFPGYPWVIEVLGHLGLPLDSAAVIVSAVAQLSCLVLLWRFLDDNKQWPALVLAGFFLGNVYMAAVFPISLFLLAALVCLWACWSGRFGVASIAGAAAATCYPTGVLLAPVALVWAVRQRRWHAAAVVVGVASGYCLVLWLLHRQAGSWDAYFKVQARYDYHLQWGLDALFARLKPLVNARYRDAKGFVTALQTLLSLALMSAMASRARRFLQDERHSLILIYATAFWLAPLTLGGRLSLYRSEAILLPAALLVPALPFRLQVALVAAAVLISVPMGVLFFGSVLV